MLLATTYLDEAQITLIADYYATLPERIADRAAQAHEEGTP